MQPERQQILGEIKRTAEANNGVPLGVARFSQETGIKETDWRGKFWARWGDALLEAGFQANEFQKAYPEDYLIEKLISLMRELHRFPVRDEISLKSHADGTFPHHKTFSRLGKRQQLVTKILSYCESRAGYEDVVEICRPLASERFLTPEDQNEETAIGYVYLMKSGKYFKLGRSNAPGRREYELAIQMPEKIVTVHKIRTDYPQGIEDYWHRRFGSKRKNGEWFDLSSTEINAFRRRKFM